MPPPIGRCFWVSCLFLTLATERGLHGTMGTFLPSPLYYASIHLNAHWVSTYCVLAVSQTAEGLPHGDGILLFPTVIKYHPREGHLHVSGEP